MKHIHISKLIISLVLCFSAAGIGSVFTTPAIGLWYASLNKPIFNPPNWIFGPVWTILYSMMAVALYLIWSSEKAMGKLSRIRKEGIHDFYIQLALNTLWSIAFFGVRMPLLAFFIIIALWLSIYMTLEKFFRISKIAGQLMTPYLAWVSFAAVLNLSIVLLN